MVEARPDGGDNNNPATGDGTTLDRPILPESVNVPVMASFNMSNIFLDPSLKDNYDASASRLKENQLYSTTLWKNSDTIRTADDLLREMEYEAEENEEEIEVREEEDLSDEDGDNEEKKISTEAH